jgi:hypothetical protein
VLRELQRTLGASLLEDFKAPPPPGLVAGDPERAAARLMIHRGNVVESLITALGHTYPVIQAIAGEHNFRVLAGAFVRARPPQRPELLRYGREFADFAAGHAAATSDFPFLPDLARLEWAIHDAYFAADSASLAPEALGAIAPGRLPALRLALHPAARLVVSERHPIHAIWAAAAAAAASSAAADRATPSEPLALSELPEGGEAVLVARTSGPVEAYKLEPGETVFLGAVAAGAPLEKAAAEALAAAPGFDLAAALAAALTRGVFGAEVTFNQP